MGDLETLRGACPACRRRIPLSRALSQLKPKPFSCKGCGEMLERASSLGWMGLVAIVGFWLARSQWGDRSPKTWMVFGGLIIAMGMAQLLLTPVKRADQSDRSSLSSRT